MWPGQLQKSMQGYYFEMCPMSQIPKGLVSIQCVFVLFCFFFFKSNWCLPKNSLLKYFSKYLFFRNPLVGSFPVFLVVIRGMIISFNMDIVLTIAVINHFGYWYSPQVLLSPVWVWFRFLNVFMRSVCTMIWPF